MNDALTAAYESARQLTAHHARTFYFASFQLPKIKRRHAYGTYAFCRYVDDQVDDASEDTPIPEVVGRLRELLTTVYSHSDPKADLPWLPAFADTVYQCDIPQSCFEDLLTGVEMDQGTVRIEDWDALYRYCYHVASVVGLMMTRVFDLKDRSHEAQAIELGVAMQLTNILRDVAEDLDRDRIYLPASELREAGITEADLRAGRHDERWKTFMNRQVARARDYYQRSEPGIPALPNDGSRLTVWVMRLIYAAILDEIEKIDYDVFKGRTHVSTTRKLGLLARAWWACRTQT